MTISSTMERSSSWSTLRTSSILSLMISSNLASSSSASYSSFVISLDVNLQNNYMIKNHIQYIITTPYLLPTFSKQIMTPLLSYFIIGVFISIIYFEKWWHQMLYLIFCIVLLVGSVRACDPCYNPSQNDNCPTVADSLDSYTLHMSVHPHLDAYWIFNFESYYDPKPSESEVRGYFMSNRFNSVKQIFQSAKNTLWESKITRQTISNRTMKAHRSFFNSEMGFFKRWYSEQNPEQKKKVKQLLKTKYWQILGGGYVQHDEGCSYYDDIIQNFQLGLHFLKEEFNYHPKIAVSADSFGHSQSTLAILSHLGVQGFFVERSDEHILLKNKTQFIWKARSSNGKYYGAMPTHIRWAIHGFQDQFSGGGRSDENFCQTKEMYMNNLRNQNTFLKRILKSKHIMRYFGHDFQRFNDYSYSVIEGMMKKFSMEKCNKVVAVYGNPTEYFIALMGEVFGAKIKPVVERNQDIFPIWDYDSGLYWTGYLTTDAYHKKNYRDVGRLLRTARKFFTPMYLSQPQTDKNKNYYKDLQLMAEQVSYLSHHDGITGTSKYMVMDTLQKQNQELYNNINNNLLADIFAEDFPLGTNSPIFTCHLDQPCQIPSNYSAPVYLKVLNSDPNVNRHIIIDLPIGQYYQADCEHQVLCFCLEQQCPCKLYIYKSISAYAAIKLTPISSSPKVKLQKFTPDNNYSNNKTHFKIIIEGREYALGYKRIQAKATNRDYDHLSRYGTQYKRGFNIQPGKYALGNDPSTVKDLSQIKQIFTLKGKYHTFFLVHWNRYKMKTLITISNKRKNEWKVQTISASEALHLSDLYFQVITPIENADKFVTDSNGWLTQTRQLFKHEDYEAFFSDKKYDDVNGNSYPVTAFIYLEDQQDKVSVNVDRPQGGIAYKKGTIWLNFDRLSADDGKWVYESAIRSQYQRYTHVVTVQNKDYNQRRLQRLYDQPMLIQGNSVSAWDRIEQMQIDLQKREQWNTVSNINNIKFTIRPFNDTKTILRVHNLHDTNTTTIGLFADKHSPFLTTFYGRTATFKSITQGSLGGNMNYGQFLNGKWNWQGVTELTKENNIFNKVFRENITLGPLQIRTFIIESLSFQEKCIEVSELKYNKQEIVYKVDTVKAAPTRDAQIIRIEQDIIDYMQNKDHCEGNSPVLQNSNVLTSPPIESKSQREFNVKPIDSDVLINAQSTEHQVLNVPQEKKIPSISKAEQKSKPIQVPKKTEQQVKKQAKTLSVRLVEIEQKIQSLLMLTQQQKQIYFANKLQMIRRWKLASKQ